jgi:hypothetical protein
MQLTEILGIIVLLGRCIIDANYRLSDDWTEPIKLTRLGDEIVRRCSSKHSRMKPNEARMAVFLEFGCASGLLVDLSTNIDRLRAKISSEVVGRHIHFPYIFGRELHDAAAESFPERTSLNNRQTIQLLRKLPIGVFQEGRTVVGPYGCTYSDMPRQLAPSRHVPGYLCSDETCSAIHTISLSTAAGPISKARTWVSDFIEQNYSDAEDEYVSIVHDAVARDLLPFIIDSSDNLIDVLSDGLNENELRAVIDLLLRQSFRDKSRRVDISKRLGIVIGSPSECVSSLSRPQLMQMALLYTNPEICNAVDEAVSSEIIKIQDFEVRVSKVRRWDPAASEPDAQIGIRGVRFVDTPSSGYVARRLLRLLHGIYYESGKWDAADLAYALEAPPDLNDAELLGRAVQELPPTEIFSRLILPTRPIMEMAAERLGIFNYSSLSRGDLLQRMLWKVGAINAAAFTELDRLEEHAYKLATANEQGAGEDALRSHSANLFAALEQVLRRSLPFCTWTLTSDHYLSTEGFEYDPLLSPSILEFIETHAHTEEAELRLRTDGVNPLTALGAGFVRLAKSLRKLQPESYRRPEHQIPVQSIALARLFAFPFTIPFMNLAESARSEVLTELQAIGRLVQDDNLLEVRNAPTHGRNFPSKLEISKALGCVGNLVDHLRQTGFYPRLFGLSSVQRDELGRERLIYEDNNSQVVLSRPRWELAPRLPAGASQLVIIPLARLQSSGPLRFYLKPRPGDDPYWDGWPRRWHTKSDYQPIDRSPLNPDDLPRTA